MSAACLWNFKNGSNVTLTLFRIEPFFSSHKTFIFNSFGMVNSYYLIPNDLLQRLAPDCCSNSVQVANKSIISSSFFLFLALNKHEWTSEGILFQPRKYVNTHHFSNSSQLTSIYSLVWFVCLSEKKWQIWLYDWSDCLSIKLPAKGKLLLR